MRQSTQTTPIARFDYRHYQRLPHPWSERKPINTRARAAPLGDCNRPQQTLRIVGGTNTPNTPICTNIVPALNTAKRYKRPAIARAVLRRVNLTIEPRGRVAFAPSGLSYR